MVELETNLRVTSDRMLRTLEQIQVLENEKRDLRPTDARFQTLAREIERLAAEVFAQTHHQKQLGERAEAVRHETAEPLSPINEVSSTRDLAVILVEWRDAERRLQLAEPDSAEHATAAADVGRLREEYHTAYASGTQQRTDQ
jgi:hypothetical protein